SLYPLFHGGGQEFSYRSGTESVAGNVSFVRALRLILERQTKGQSHLALLKEIMVNRFANNDDILINTPEESAPHILNVSVPGLKPETIINKLSEQNIYISTQSA